MDVNKLAFDRDKVLAWWTGRFSNADLAVWTGQSERDVRLILDTPFMRGQITGGGRGSKTTRRVSRKARNAVAIVAALRRAGLSIEAAASLLDAAPVLADFPTETIDFSPTILEAPDSGYSFRVSLPMVLPNQGWLPVDVVPQHVFNRRCRPMVREGAADSVSLGEIAWYPEWIERLIGRLPGGMKVLGDPMYRPEIDPLGMIDYGHDLPDAHDALDHHFYIVDGRWIWMRHSNPDPRQYFVDTFQSFEMYEPRRFDQRSVTFDFEPIVEIDVARRTSAFLRLDTAKERMVRRAWEQPKTKLDVNATVAVREMKRVALGLIAPP